MNGLDDQSVREDAVARALVIQIAHAADALMGDVSSGIMRNIRSYKALERLVETLRLHIQGGLDDGSADR
jgi:hypothetical protein